MQQWTLLSGFWLVLKQDHFLCTPLEQRSLTAKEFFHSEGCIFIKCHFIISILVGPIDFTWFVTWIWLILISWQQIFGVVGIPKSLPKSYPLEMGAGISHTFLEHNAHGHSRTQATSRFLILASAVRILVASHKVNHRLKGLILERKRLYRLRSILFVMMEENWTHHNPWFRYHQTVMSTSKI